MKFRTFLGLLAVSCHNGALGFAPVASRISGSRSNVSPRVACLPLAAAAMPDEQRRKLLGSVASVATAILMPLSSTAAELPSVTSAEFDTILKDSAKSILGVELSGPKSETALVKLVDGTTFEISDLRESPTDPRSPLKLVSRCRLYKVPIKNTGLLSAVGSDGISKSGKKKKSYANERVRLAEEKNKERAERMAQDERERLEELYRLEGEDSSFLK